MKESTGLDDALVGTILERVNMIEAWCREVRAEGKRRLEAGIAIPGWKLVEGRAGNRQWVDEDEAAQIMKGARLKQDEMYTKKLITFPQAEKKLKKSKPKVWTKLERLLTQKAGAPAVAPETDKRPALVIAQEDQFGDESDMSGLV